MIKALGYATTSSLFDLHPHAFERAEPGPQDVQIDVLYCGVCHSDVHQVKNDWGNTVYPCMPGHEIVGKVARVGAEVTRFKVGDVVGVGCMIDSCHHCDPCKRGEENYCEGPNSWLATYNGPMKPAAQAGGQNMYGRDNTFGGYSNVIVVREDFVLRIPAGLDPAKAAPLLCAGITTYSPLRHWNVQAGQKVGVVGIGGLGHLAIKLARALGAHVVGFTTDRDKLPDITRLGAHDAVLESDAAAMKAHEMSFDFILSTVPEKHDINPFIKLLKRDSTFTLVGALEPLKPVNHMEVAMHRRAIAGSLIGGIRETQEALDFCAQHGITPDIEMIPIQEVNAAYKKMNKEEVRYRFVIDMASLAKDSAKG